MANDEQRDAIAQALMVQQSGVNPPGGATSESQALMLASPAAYYAKYGGGDQQYGGDPNFDPLAAQSNPPDPMAQRAAQMRVAQTPSAMYFGMTPQDYGQYFSPKPMPSGSVPDQSPKLFAWGGYSDAGRAPGGELPFYGNGASAYGNPNYWFGTGAGAQSMRGGYGSDPAGGATLESQMLMLQNPAAYYERYGGGPGNSGAAGMGDMGGMSGGSTGISDQEMGKAIADVNSQRGQPAQEFSLSPFSHGFETYGRSAQDYNPVNDPYSFDAFSTQQSAMQQSHQAAEAMNAVQQAAQDAADDAEADAADGSAW